MQQQGNKNEEDGPLMGWFGCAFAPEITVMAAAGLWQDLREGLGHAELICGDMIGKRRGPAWCGQLSRVHYADLTDLTWSAVQRGGE